MPPPYQTGLSLTLLLFWSRNTQKRTIHTMASLSVVTYTLVFGCICSGS